MSTGVSRKMGRDRWITIATDWAGYRAMLRIVGDRRSPRVIYVDGRMTLVSPGFSHETITERSGRLVDMVTLAFRIKAVPSGSTTLRFKPSRCGVEGDKSYYFANAYKLKGKTEIDLNVDPPPDLAIEAVVSHPVKDALTAYRRLRVPEVWVGNARTVKILVLQADGTYAEAASSVSLPMLTAAMINDWVHRPLTGDETEWLADLHDWVFNVLVPQNRAGGQQP